MRQIASEYYIKNTFNITGVTSNGDNYCPTYQEIISTSKIGVNGTYSNNQLVCQEDLFSMSNYVTIYLINQSGHELINVYIAANGNGYLDISSDHTAGSLTNLADGDEERMVFDKGSDSDNTYMIGYEYSMFEGEDITEPLWIGFSENSNDVEFKYDGDGYVATINYDNKELYIQAPTKEKEITITYYTFVDDNTSNISIPLKLVFDHTQATTMVMALTDEYWNEQITSDFSVYDKSRGNNVNILNNGIVVCNTSSNMYLNVCNNSGITRRHIISDGDGINMGNMTLNTDNLAIVLSNRENDYVNPKRGKLFLFMWNGGEGDDTDGEYYLELTSPCLSEVSGKFFSKANFEEYSIGRILFPEYSYDMFDQYTPCVMTYTSNLIAGNYYMVVNGYEYKYTLTEANINAINNGENVYIDSVEANGEVNW